MISGIGIDIVENYRITVSLKKDSSKFLKKIFNQEEIDNFIVAKDYVRIAGAFALKEAIIKAIKNGTGIEISFLNIILKRTKSGIPLVKSVFNNKNIKDLPVVKTQISVSHENNYSIAFAVCEIIKKDAIIVKL